MEVFIRNMPERTTEAQVEAFLRDILKKFSIDNFHCNKRKGKPFCGVTFLNYSDGDTFLKRFGAQAIGLRRKGIDQLKFQGTVLNCTLSYKKPDPQALKSLEMEARAKQKQKANPAQGVPDLGKTADDPSSLQVSSISCGTWWYVGEELGFLQYVKWPEPGSLTFGPRLVILKTEAGQIMEIPHLSVQTVACDGLPHPAITLTLKEAPRFYEPAGEPQSGNDATDFASWLARLRVSMQRNHSMKRISAWNSEHEKIAGSCLVYRIRLLKSTFDEQIRATNQARGILPPPIRSHNVAWRPRCLFSTAMNLLLQAMSNTPLPFAAKFQLQKLAQNGYLPPDVVVLLIPEIASMMTRARERVCIRAIRQLFRQLPFPGPETEAREFEPQVLIDLLKDNEDRVKRRDLYMDDSVESQNTAVIHRVFVTPAGIYLYGPEPENNNRVLRKYPNHHDHFVRVLFCDEDGLQVQFHPEASNDYIFYKRFTEILNEGIYLGGRRFAFLGFSHSSLRAQSCWFMAPFIHNGSLLYDRELIKGLGNFSHIQCPAKCAARIGQAFSETATAITLAPGVAKEMYDIERNGRVFSDGVGTMSMSVLQQIWDGLPASKRTKPTLFQIRHKGSCAPADSSFGPSITVLSIT
jgi:hypothetical protein